MAPTLKRDDLRWQLLGDECILVLPAALSEDFQFPVEAPKISQKIVLDCRHVQHVSSIWAAKFITWHRGISRRQQYAFRNCPRKMIDLMNYVQGFLPHDSIVESFTAPYECAHCGYEQTEIMTRGKHYLEATSGEAAILRIPFELNCDKCPGMMEFSVLENIYLRFLSSQHESKK